MNHHHALIRSLLLEAWFIEPAYAQLMLPTVIDMIEGKKNPHFQPNLKKDEKDFPSLLNEDFIRIVLSSDGAGNFSGFGAAPSGSTAVIPIRGAITKYDGMCSYGVESYMGWIAEAEQSNAITDITFLIDSPGGQANCSFMLARQIANLKKPTLAFVDAGSATSAAYLIGSACDKFYVNTPVDMLGSIGAMYSLTDYSAQLQGTKTWEIYSRLSPEKSLAYRRLKENNDPSLLEDILDENVIHFVNEVKKNRGDRLNLAEADPFKGATYTAEKALKIGLIDGIAPLSEALTILRSSKKQIPAASAALLTTEDTQNETEMSWKTKLASWLMEQPDEAPEAAATPAAAATETPATPEASATTIETPAAPATPQAATPAVTETPELTTEQRLAVMEARLTSLQTENAQLKSVTPAAAATSVLVAKESVPQAVEGDPNATSFFSETDEIAAKLKAGLPV